MCLCWFFPFFFHLLCQRQILCLNLNGKFTMILILRFFLILDFYFCCLSFPHSNNCFRSQLALGDVCFIVIFYPWHYTKATISQRRQWDDARWEVYMISHCGLSCFFFSSFFSSFVCHSTSSWNSQCDPWWLTSTMILILFNCPIFIFTNSIIFFFFFFQIFFTANTFDAHWSWIEKTNFLSCVWQIVNWNAIQL